MVCSGLDSQRGLPAAQPGLCLPLWLPCQPPWPSTLSSSPPRCPSLSRWPYHLCAGMVKEPPHVPHSLFLSLSLLENECLWLRLTSPLPDEDCHPFTWGEKSLLPTRLTVWSRPHHSFPFTGKPPGGIVYSHWKRFALTSLDTDTLFSSRNSGFLYLCWKEDTFF